MPFDYYHRLKPRQQRVYRRSDELVEVPLPDAVVLSPLVEKAAGLLAGDRRADLQRTCQALADGITGQLEVPPVQVRVLAARPSRTWGELHGLYEPLEDGTPARLTVWMRTARQRRIVAFKTFLRTLLHELLHHLDYEYYKLPWTFHTEGFFKRESSLVRQLLPGSDGGPGNKAPARAK